MAVLHFYFFLGFVSHYPSHQTTNPPCLLLLFSSTDLHLDSTSFHYNRGCPRGLFPSGFSDITVCNNWFWLKTCLAHCNLLLWIVSNMLEVSERVPLNLYFFFVFSIQKPFMAPLLISNYWITYTFIFEYI